MAATVSTGFLAQVIQYLPRRLLGALDAWSHRIARRRHDERMRKWQARRALAQQQASR